MVKTMYRVFYPERGSHKAHKGNPILIESSYSDLFRSNTDKPAISEGEANLALEMTNYLKKNGSNVPYSIKKERSMAALNNLFDNSQI